VITVHNVEPHRRNAAFAPRFLAPILDAMDAIIVHTEPNRSRLEALYPRVLGRVHVVPHAAWTPAGGVAKDAARVDLGIPASEHVVLFFGAIRRNKGLGLLLEAIKDLSDRGRVRPRLIVAGLPDRDGFDEYEEAICRLQIGDLVDRRLNFVPEKDVAKYYSACDVVALPYEASFQAQSGILLDAYSHERPVVVTDVGGVGATVREDGTGEVLTRRTPADLADAIERVLLYPERQLALGDRLRHLRATKYSWSEMATRTRAVYADARKAFAKRAQTDVIMRSE
jgi:glycosyltransferase involved in cell wall biosynthesis